MASPTPRPDWSIVMRWIAVGAAAALLAALFDREIALFGASLPWAVADIADILTEFGEGQWIIIPSVAIFIWGWRSGRDNLARWAFLLGVTVASSGGIANLLKVIFARWRPAAWIEGEHFGFEWFESGWTRASFPSGHATTAGAAALICALWFPRLKWWIVGLGASIAATRVILGMHYTSDVLAGWALGGLCVIIALRIWWRASPSTVPCPSVPSWPRSPVAIAWTAIALGTLMRVLAGAWLPLGVDESYEVATCHSVVAAGFDHPPMVYWLTRFGLALNGAGFVDAIWVRLPFIALFALTSWFGWRLGTVCFSPAAGAWTAVLLNLSAFFAIAVGGWALPDGPLIASVLAMALVLALGGVLGVRADGRPPWSPWATWTLSGAALGVAALSKYQALFVGVGVLLFLLSTRDGRRSLRTAPPWIGALIALACTLPVIIWNANHDWASVRFQSARANGEGGIHLMRFIETIGATAGIILPWIWAPLLFEWIKALRTGTTNRATWFFACVGGLPIVTFLAISLFSQKGLPHWSGVGYLCLFPLLGLATAHELAAGKRALVRNWLAFSAIVLPLAVAVGVSHSANGWVTRALDLPASIKDGTLESLSWENVRTYLERRALSRVALRSSTSSSSTGATATAPVTEAFAPPPPDKSSWEKTAPKATRPPRPPESVKPLPQLAQAEMDALVQCGGEGSANGKFFVAGINWRDTGKLAAAIHGTNVPILCLSADPRQFQWSADPSALAGADALVIVSNTDAAAVTRELATRFATLDQIATMHLYRGESIAETLTVFCATGFNP